MSAEAFSWVMKYSPAKGAAFTVHLVIGDVANDGHNYELWMRQAWLAARSRLSRRACHQALGWLVEAGLLEVLEEGKKRGSPNRYRMLLPDLDEVAPALGGTQDLRTGYARDAQGGTQDLRTGVRTSCAQNSSSNSTENTSDALTAARFAKFWAAYPARDGKKLNKERTRVRFVKLSYEEQRAAWTGANNIAAAIAAGGTHGPPNPDRWVKDRLWEDWQEPADVSPNGKSEAQSWSMAYTQ